MLARTILIVLFLGAVSCSPSLQSLREKNKVDQRQYRTMVILRDQTEQEGILYAVDSLGITLQQKSRHIFISMNDIWEIRARRKGNVLKGMGIGFAAGAGIGAAIGFGSEEPEPENVGDVIVGGQVHTISAGVTTVVVGLLGGVMGGFIGTNNPYKFYIRGNPVNFRNYYKDLLLLSFEREIED